MAGFESAYVALSRMKQHVQVYTDNRQGWTDAINNAVQKGTAHDVLEPKPDREVMKRSGCSVRHGNCGTWRRGRAVLRQAGLAGETALHGLCAPGRKYPQPYVALPAFDRNGKSAGIWLNPLTTDDGNGLRGFSGEGRVKAAGMRSSWPCRVAVTERACWLIICRMVSGLPVIILTAVWW